MALNSTEIREIKKDFNSNNKDLSYKILLEYTTQIRRDVMDIYSIPPKTLVLQSLTFRYHCIINKYCSSTFIYWRLQYHFLDNKKWNDWGIKKWNRIRSWRCKRSCDHFFNKTIMAVYIFHILDRNIFRKQGKLWPLIIRCFIEHQKLLNI